MRFIKNYSQYRIYKKFELKPDTKKITHGNAFLLITENFASSSKIINSNLFQNNVGRSYFMDRDLDPAVFKNRKVFNRNEHYKDVKKDTGIIRAVNAIGTLKKENIYVDTYRGIHEILSAPYMTSKMIKVDAFGRYMQDIITSLSNLSYENVYITIDAETARNEFKREDILRGSSLFSIMYLWFKDKITDQQSIFNFPGKLILNVYDPITETGMYVDLKSEKFNITKFLNSFVIYNKFISSEELSPEELADIGDETNETLINNMSDPRDFIRNSTFWMVNDTGMGVADKFNKLFTSAEDAFIDYMISNGASYDKEEHVLYVKETAPWKTLSKTKFSKLK